MKYSWELANLGISAIKNLSLLSTSRSPLSFPMASLPPASLSGTRARLARLRQRRHSSGTSRNLFGSTSLDDNGGGFGCFARSDGQRTVPCAGRKPVVYGTRWSRG